jgi:hypothetical protein
MSDLTLNSQGLQLVMDFQGITLGTKMAIIDNDLQK